MKNDQLVMGIETSCDETAVSIVKNGREIVSNVVASQIESHKRFGGVVPEIASRHHVEQITIVLEEALKEANCRIMNIRCHCCNRRTGTGWSFIIGVNAAKAVAFAQWNSTCRCSSYCWSYLCESVSKRNGVSITGLSRFRGHTELVYMKEHGHFEVIGETRDDAAGEAYDKVARRLHLRIQVDRILID